MQCPDYKATKVRICRSQGKPKAVHCENHIPVIIEYNREKGHLDASLMNRTKGRDFTGKSEKNKRGRIKIKIF